MPVMELPPPEENEGAGLIQEKDKGIDAGMQAEDTKSYTVQDEFRISWFRDKLRNDGKFGGVRDSIHEETLTEPASRYVLPYLNYLTYKEHNIVVADEDVIAATLAVQTNYGKDTIYCTYKVVV